MKSKLFLLYVLTSLSCLCFSGAAVAAVAAVSAGPLSEELIAAAQGEDVAKVRALLEAGVPVDGRSMYGATALFFTVDKGQVEMVELLLEAGADVNVEDSFYGSSPLAWSLFAVDESQPHREIALLLLARGAGPADRAVLTAARLGDLELLRAAMATGGVTAEGRREALAQLEEAGETGQAGESEVAEAAKEAMIALLSKDLPVETETAEPETAEGEAEEAAEKSAAVAEPEPLASAKRAAGIQWPSFRGPAASGIGDGQGVPTTWDGEAGTNVLWKTEIPGTALSSPVIWGERVFVATAMSEAGDESIRTGLYGDVDSVEDDSTWVWRVYALNKRNGKVLWQHDASKGRPKVKRHMKSSHANPTPAVDARHLVVHFPSEGLFCFDHDGQLLWKRDLGVLPSGWFFDPTYEWGFASSPILHDGRVIVQADIYEGSFLGAWDVETGEPVWRTERDEIPSWSTPAVLPGGSADGLPEGPGEIVTNAKTVRGYDADTGKELWTLGPNSEIVVGTPIVVNGVALVTGGYPPARPIYAIRPGGRGDLSLGDGDGASEHIAWRQERGGTYMPTPIAYEGILYMFNNNGRLAAYDVETGELIYRKRVGGGGGSFASSPLAADGRLFFTSEDGTTYVARSGRTYAELAKNELEEVVMATPAISDGLLVIRGMRHVYGIGSEAEATD